MTKDELIALLLMAGFTRQPMHSGVGEDFDYPSPAMGLLEMFVRLRSNGNWMLFARYDPNSTALTCNTEGTPDDHDKCWEAIKELLDDQR